MKEIVLHGSLGARFGERFFLDVKTAGEAVHALSVQLPGFRDAIAKGNWHFLRGPLESNDSLTEQELPLGLGHTNQLHLLPAAEGAGNGILTTIVGVALIVVGVVTANPYLVAAGVGVTLGGVMQMTSPVAADDYANRERPDQRPSFTFDGPVNTSTQGLPVPIICGRVKCGSVVISAGMTAEQI